MNSGGFHYNGAMLIPPVSRFKDCPIKHIADYQGLYTRGKIARVHVKEIDDRVYGIADYSAKTVKWGRADEQDILILPKIVREITDTTPVLSAEEKGIKDIQSSLNVCDELARQIYQKKRRAG